MRYFGDAAAKHDDIKRAFCRCANRAIELPHFGVVDAGFLQVGACHGSQLRLDFQGDDTLRLMCQQRSQVARAGANFQHLFMLLHGSVLQQSRLQARREHALAVADRDLHVNKGQRLVRQGHKVFALDHGQQVQHLVVQNVPWTNLLFDHVEARLFEVHFFTPWGRLTDLAKFYPLAPSAGLQRRRSHCARSSR